MKTSIFFMTGWLAAAGCSWGTGPDEKVAEEVATAFAEAYFDCDLTRALRYVTPESRRWVAFAASNVGQATVDLLNGRGEDEQTTVTLTGREQADDSTVVVRLRVENGLAADSIGAAGSIGDGDCYALRVVNREGRWMVKMEGLPRSERRSRD